MSDIFFTNIDEAPVPPDEVRIRELTAQPRPDGVRIKVHFALTPFQKRPNIEVDITNAEGRQVAAFEVVEAIDPKMDVTMHIREARPSGHYTLGMSVFYADIESQAPADGTQASAGDLLAKARQVVDQRRIQFEVRAATEN